MIKSSEELIIYETTDGEKTIYSRKSGSSDRDILPSKHFITKWYEWRDIIQLAETEPSLADIINKAEMLYAILKKEN